MQPDIAAVVASLTLPSGITLRAWTEADFPAIQQLTRAEGWTTQDIHPDELRAAWQHSWPALVVVEGAGEESGGVIIGSVRAITDGAITVYVADLIVSPAFRGIGLGAMLVEACHRLVPTARLDLLAVADAAAFYEHIGFRPFRGYRKSFR